MTRRCKIDASGQKRILCGKLGCLQAMVCAREEGGDGANEVGD